MNKNHKAILIWILSIAALIAVLVMVYHISQRETYLSDDPLYGSFNIENKALSDPIYPTDFLLSIDVASDHAALLKCAKVSKVDISKGCWVYSFDENKIFRAEKKGDKLQVYENSKVIGAFEYSAKKFLWMDYDEIYTAVWRGKELNLTRIMQGFMFP